MKGPRDRSWCGVHFGTCVSLVMLATGVSCGQGFDDEPDRAAATRASLSLAPRNIILLVADGGGASALRATRLFTGGPLVMDSG